MTAQTAEQRLFATAERCAGRRRTESPARRPQGLGLAEAQRPTQAARLAWSEGIANAQRMSSADAEGGRLERRVGRERWQGAMTCATEAASAATAPNDETACGASRRALLLECSGISAAPSRGGTVVRWPPKDGQPGTAPRTNCWRDTVFAKCAATCMSRMNCERPTNEFSRRRRRSAGTTGWARAMAGRDDLQSRSHRRCHCTERRDGVRCFVPRAAA